MAIETTLWDPASRVTTPEAEFAYLDAAFECSAAGIIAAVLRDIGRARGMRKTKLATAVSLTAIQAAAAIALASRGQ